jgi:hypothetical protein
VDIRIDQLSVGRFYIHAEYVANNHLHDNHSIFPNIIFDPLLKTPPSHLPPNIHTLKTVKTQTFQYMALPPQKHAIPKGQRTRILTQIYIKAGSSR